MPRAPRVATSLFSIFSLLAAGTCLAANAERGPYVEGVQPQSAVIGLRLDSSCGTSVRYGPDAQHLTQTAQSGQSGTQHFVHLTGLQPSTHYTYEVDACGTSLGAGGTFVTAPAPGTRTVHFAAMGDFGTGGPEEIQTAQAMSAVHPEFWLALGDDAYENGSESDWTNHFFQPLQSLIEDVPVFPALGNHEYGTRNAQPYLDAFELPTNNSQNSERYYSFDWGEVHVSVLDSQCAVGTSSSDCSKAAQKTWLTQDLAQSSALWKIAVFHHPVYSTGSHGSTPQMQEFIPIFEQGGVDLVLTGHDHVYERTKPMKAGQAVAAGTQGAVVYMVVGTGGAGSYQFQSPMPSYDAVRQTSIFGFLDLATSGGTLTGKLIDFNGQTRDTFSLNKAVPAPTVQLVAEPQQGAAPLLAHLTATANPPDAQVAWDFGDGQTGEGTTAQHTWADPGTYTVTATATVGAQSATASTLITVNAPGTGDGGGDDGGDGGGHDHGDHGDDGGTPSGPGTEPTSSAATPKGGCTASAAAPIALLAGLGLVAFGRRRRRRE